MLLGRICVRWLGAGGDDAVAGGLVLDGTRETPHIGRESSQGSTAALVDADLLHPSGVRPRPPYNIDQAVESPLVASPR